MTIFCRSDKYFPYFFKLKKMSIDWIYWHRLERSCFIFNFLMIYQYAMCELRYTCKGMPLFFIFSQFDWICCNGPQGVCLCVCPSVCLSVSSLQPKQVYRFSSNYLRYICEVSFSPILKIQIWWRHGGHYCCFRFRHSYGRNFAPIFFLIEHKVQSCLPMFATENQ